MEKDHGELLERIMLRIEAEERREARTRTAFFGALFTLALVAFIPAWRELSLELSQSGFFHFASLAFSDAGTLLSSWKEFALALAESFPAFGISSILASVFALLISAKFIANDVRGAMERTRRTG